MDMRQARTLTFTLTPGNNSEDNTKFITDDLDFAVYELPNGIGQLCQQKLLAGCRSQYPSQWRSCTAEPVGQLQRINWSFLTDTDIQEPAGCSLAGQNNFVRALDMEAGKSYVLIVNNFSRSGLGFSIEFGGSGNILK